MRRMDRSCDSDASCLGLLPVCSAGCGVVTPSGFPDPPRHHAVPCVLHFLIAIGCLLCAFILSTSPEKHKEVKEVLRIAKVGWNMAVAGSPDGEETKCLLEVWPQIASTLGFQSSMADKAVLQMSNLIRQLYRSWQSEGEHLAAECETVDISFARHVAPRSESTYLFMLQHNFPLSLKSIYPAGLGMFCADICETWNCILKRFDNHHTNRGGSRGLTVKKEGHALTSVLESAFIYSYWHVVANGLPRRVGCTNAQLYEEFFLH